MVLSKQHTVYKKYRVCHSTGQTDIRCAFCGEWTAIRTAQPIVVGMWTRIPLKTVKYVRSGKTDVREKKRCRLIWIARTHKAQGCFRCGWIFANTQPCNPPFRTPSKGMVFLNLGKRDQILKDAESL